MELFLFFVLIAMGIVFSLPGSIIIFYLSYNAFGKDLKPYQEIMIKLLMLFSGLNIAARVLSILGIIRVLGGA